MQYFTELKKHLSGYMDTQEIARINKAYLLAEKAHHKQVRETGEPYIVHPVATAIILAKLRLDTETIMAALLHDVLEDTALTKADILEEFGPSITQLVEGVSKLTHITFFNKTEAQAENFCKMMLAMTKDLRVILIKLADRLHNMQTLGVLSPQKRLRIARETLNIYAPLANRLGMYNLKMQLENLCFMALHAYRARILQDTVKNMLGNRQEVFRGIEKALGNVLAVHKFTYVETQGRRKHLYSIYSKMRERRLSLTQIMDMFAFRIIVGNVEDCYRALGCIHNFYKPVSERFKDYIAVPKINGYQSLHTTLFGPYGVPIEVQIRTQKMHKMAEYGIAAHSLYKSNQRAATTWVKNLLDMQEGSANAKEFIENVKLELFPDEIYVFTPKGDIYELPSGATPVDFAYAVNIDLGNNCVAVRIDNRYASLNTPLFNGQIVQIIAPVTSSPNIGWLDFVVTTKARSCICNYFEQQRRNGSTSLGKHLLE